MNWFKFKTLGKLPIILGESIEYLKLMKTNPKMLPCDWLDLVALGSQPSMPKNLPRKRVGIVRATHTRLTARDHYTSSTLIGGEGGAGPSSLHTTLEGPTEYVNARWM